MNKNRNKLISLAVKYNGEWDLIRRGVIKGEGDPNFEYNFNAITILDDDYPIELFDLERTPFVLFYKGNLDLLKNDKIGIVGCRNASEYSKSATENFIANNKDKTFVSGLEGGISTVVHQSTGSTIAVLDNGINSIPFFEERTLYKMIEQRGLLISEYPKEKKLTESVTDARNRIIAALSNELTIMEMKEHSDKLSTLNYAEELGRKVKILEFPDESNSVINNSLIKNGVEKL